MLKRLILNIKYTYMQVFVLGMHRSGTSTLSRLLNMMGLYFGTEGISTRANEENPKGFWERKDVRELNDYILQENGFDWNQIAGFEGLQTFSEESITQFDKKAKQLIINLDAFRPWFLKEPRFCLTLPLWKRHLEVPIIIFIYRHPLEVAKSLEYRNGYSLEYGLAMWERYTELAIEHSAGFPSLVVSYNKLLENPGEVINIIHEFLTRQGVHGLRVPNKRELDGFIDTSLHRQKVSSISLNELSSSQSNLFALLEHSLHDSINFSFKSGKIKKILKDSEESIMLDKQLKEDYLKLKEKLKENNLQLKQYEEKYKDDLKKIQEQNKELRQKQKEDINAFKSELQKVQIKLIEKTIESFKSDIKELKAQTQRLSQSLEKKSNELNSVTLTLEKERFIHQSDKKIIDELNSLTKEQRAQIESLEENLNTSKKHTRNVERHFQGIESRLASKVKSLQETLKQKEKQAKEKDSTIERLWQANQDSRISRRITKPFRFLFSLPVKVVKKITSFLKKKEPETFYSLVENLIDLNRYPQHTEFKSLYLASESSVAAAASEANDLLTKSNPLISVIMPTYNRA
ncbi:MAG: sulfotransferase, partial [Fulvivirga sp.]|uniref:sulfotransferase family protein n=1 Tax=Fulvivirga sp. TaxID=1931237 RepID=UPI0032EEA5EF